jgi:hypothetical protein
MFQAVTPEVDGNGCFFLCPGCGARNALVNVAKPGDEAIALAQPDE